MSDNIHNQIIKTSRCVAKQQRKVAHFDPPRPDILGAGFECGCSCLIVGSSSAVPVLIVSSLCHNRKYVQEACRHGLSNLCYSLNDHCSRCSSAIANCCYSILSRLQLMEECGQDAGAGATECVSKRNSPSKRVDIFGAEA